MTACGAKQSRTLRVPFDRICRSSQPFGEKVPDIIVSILDHGAHFGGARDLRPNMRPKAMEVSSRYPGYDRVRVVPTGIVVHASPANRFGTCIAPDPRGRRLCAVVAAIRV